VSSAVRRAGLLAGTALALAAGPVCADDLRVALDSAYRTNPSLQSARANQRATDENVPIERSDAMPKASAQASYAETLKATDSLTGPDRIGNASVSLSVPIYAGGSIRNSVRAAEIRVAAGQADLRGTESAIFSGVVSAYMNVIMNEAIVGLNRKLVEVLTVNLQATSDRFEIGDLTRTDVAQSQARLALAQGDTRSAEANLAAAREGYIQLVGKPPVDLAPPPPLPGLPASAEQAVTIALDENPDILAARERSKASEYDIKVAGSARLPRVEAYTSGAYTDYFGSLGSASSAGVFAQSQSSAQAGVRATIPIFQGGFPAALRRQAQARSAAALEAEIAVERDVVAQTRAAFSSWAAANELIGSAQTAIDAAELSLEGVRAENTVGNRTVLDILDAERELLQARVRLVTARRNAYVAGFTLLAAMGRAEAKDLNLDGGALYDPDLNYRRVRGKWFDWDDDPTPAAQSTRTVDTPVQDGSIRNQ